jgi:hypothetical protein
MTTVYKSGISTKQSTLQVHYIPAGAFISVCTGKIITDRTSRMDRLQQLFVEFYFEPNNKAKIDWVCNPVKVLPTFRCFILHFANRVPFIAVSHSNLHISAIIDREIRHCQRFDTTWTQRPCLRNKAQTLDLRAGRRRRCKEVTCCSNQPAVALGWGHVFHFFTFYLLVSERFLTSFVFVSVPFAFLRALLMSSSLRAGGSRAVAAVSGIEYVDIAFHIFFFLHIPFFIMALSLWNVQMYSINITMGPRRVCRCDAKSAPPNDHTRWQWGLWGGGGLTRIRRDKIYQRGEQSKAN